MKQVFICEFCGETYDNMNDAADCELSHWHIIPTTPVSGIHQIGINEDLDSVQIIKIPVRRRNLTDGKPEYAMLVCEAVRVEPLGGENK